ncbi:2Fe-2S iron-sulfur cluster binding domain-containing protein [Shewanella canadensis]|uniref:2Fe-2S iron-sulfur cluster binding domain-containing protein n=1 Tax=Shewanella canadensis TaxID=271096 RepID=A0A431WTB8_9GAMM|nr:2Fe-2S iron-sulfur cluster-binding protein [Shewanella canadensis]RTR38786.1 2Fe-2S iron-sulfur cluster binding domain-containing protein [Shewanella canadensis]
MSLIKTFHKWLSLLVGLQLLVWLGTGLYFNVMDHDKASGNQNRQRVESPAVDLQRLIEPKTVIREYDTTVSMSLITLLSHPYYLLIHEKGLYRHFKNSYSLVDAVTGKPFVITKTIATVIALESYKGTATVAATVKLTGPSDDFPKEQNSLWQVNIDDDLNTSVYVDAGSGRLIGHSNDDKRFVDFIFMLHFMDYASEGSFNNVQVIVFAIFTLFFAFTGLIWTVELGFNGQYRPALLLGRKLAKTKKVKVFDKHSKSIGQLAMASHENLLDSLLNHDIALPSTCGGGGTCGRCKIVVDSAVKMTSADRSQLTEQELQAGYRLACQHNSDELEQLTLVDVTEAETHELELISSEFISPYIKQLRFKSVSGERVEFRAGAFMRFFIPAAKGSSIPAYLPVELLHHWQDVIHMEYEHLACSRNYSLANGDGQTDELVFTVKIQTSPNERVKPGIGSSYICNLAPGETIEAVGPFEEFYARPSSSKPMVLVGAGSGMAPLKALIEEQLIKNTSSRELYFYFGARSQLDLIYSEHFQQLSDSYPNFHYLPVLSRPGQDWNGATGYVQDHLGEELATELEKALDKTEFYLCGPAAMMESTIELLKSHSIADNAIAFDKFE